ncbi:MAG: septal ring lytic transglycosylase RlpA family protein [Xanthomonadales bacterium]
MQACSSPVSRSRLVHANLIMAGLLSLLLISCAGEQKKEPEPGDGPSTSGLKASDVKDAVPRAEPPARYGNHTPYEVFGKKYTVLQSNQGYHERGVASWYGSKFHGRRTSSGEPYDMHLATAAHKSLPLPTYAEVTNLDNGRTVIVKINDRGPFKKGRLIDLSYGAALRLDMIATGTARVDVRVIDVSSASQGQVLADAGGEHAIDREVDEGDNGEIWLQAGAYGRREGAEQLAGRLEQADVLPVSIHNIGNLFRVWLGPYVSAVELESVISQVIELGFERPHRVRR